VRDGIAVPAVERAEFEAPSRIVECRAAVQPGLRLAGYRAVVAGFGEQRRGALGRQGDAPGALAAPAVAVDAARFGRHGQECGEAGGDGHHDERRRYRRSRRSLFVVTPAHANAPCLSTVRVGRDAGKWPARG